MTRLDALHAAHVAAPTRHTEAALYREADRLARALASRYRNFAEDAAQDALEAFVLALRSFDGRGSLHGYATVKMRHAIADGLRVQDWLTRDHRKAIKRGEAHPVVRVDASHNDLVYGLDGEASEGHVLEAEDHWPDVEAEMDRRRSIVPLLRSLKPRTRDMMLRRLAGMQLKTIGEAHGVTEARVQQITSGAVRHLHSRFTSADRATAHA